MFDVNTPLTAADLRGLREARVAGRSQVVDVDRGTGLEIAVPALAGSSLTALRSANNVASRFPLPPDGSAVRLYLDGAHTGHSVAAAAAWFAEASSRDEHGGGGDAIQRRRVLVFNCGAEKHAVPMLSTLAALRPRFDAVHFAPTRWSLAPSTAAAGGGSDSSTEGRSWHYLSARAAVRRFSEQQRQLIHTGDAESGSVRLDCSKLEVLLAAAGDIEAEAEVVAAAARNAQAPGAPSLRWQRSLTRLWAALLQLEDPGLSPAAVFIHSSVSDALVAARAGSDGDERHILVTGSLYVVGEALEASGVDVP